MLRAFGALFDFGDEIPGVVHSVCGSGLVERDGKAYCEWCDVEVDIRRDAMPVHGGD
jgi:hypothetical protein